MFRFLVSPGEGAYKGEKGQPKREEKGEEAQTKTVTTGTMKREEKKTEISSHFPLHPFPGGGWNKNTSLIFFIICISYGKAKVAGNGRCMGEDTVAW